MLLCGSLAKAQIQLCSDPIAGFPFYQQRHPVWSLLLARPLHSDVCDYSVIGDLPTIHPSLESSGRFSLLTRITEQIKFGFAWKDINTVQRFLCRPDKQEQDKRLERCAAFFRELILLSFKNVSLSFTYRTSQNNIFVGHVNRWKTMSCWEGLGKKLSLGRRNGYVASFGFSFIALWGRRRCAYILKTPCLRTAVLHRDDGRNRLRALTCEKSSW